MPVPDFIASLREKVGHELLWLSGVSAVVVNEDGSVLLTRRRDNGEWAVVSGILEPGEQPAQAIVREVLEETGVTASVRRLVSVTADTTSRVLPNGDRCQYLDLTFACDYVSGTPFVADDENIAVGWFDVDAMPAMNDVNRLRIQRGLVADPHELPYYET